MSGIEKYERKYVAASLAHYHLADLIGSHGVFQNLPELEPTIVTIWRLKFVLNDIKSVKVEVKASSA